jgi:hypothetical protein
MWGVRSAPARLSRQPVRLDVAEQPMGVCDNDQL